MFKTSRYTPYLAILFFAGTLLGSWHIHAENILGFTPLETKNKCLIKSETGKYVPIKIKQSYPFGSVVKTGRNSSMILEFSQGNTFQLLARTKLTITEDVRNPKLKIIKLEKGTINLSLDHFPKDHKLQVETPTAVCGAVGTRFVVSFEDEAKTPKTRENSFSCDRGEIFVSSRFTVKEKPVIGKSFDVPSMKAGSAMVAVIHQGQENSYSDITVNRGKLTFEYGGKKSNTFTVAPKKGKSARFICAQEKTASSTNLLAMEVKAGKIENTTHHRFSKDETVEISATSGPVVITKTKVLAQPEKVTAVSDYLLAAKVEGEAHSKLVDMTKQGASKEKILQQEERVHRAAKIATKLRKQLLSRRTRRLLRQLRQGSQRIQMRKIHRHHR